MDFQVTVTGELDQPLSEAMVDAGMCVLEKYGAAIALGTPDQPNRIEVTLSVEGADRPSSAIVQACDAVEDALGIWAHWIGGEAKTYEEADRALDEPTIPELVSGVEASEILGVSRQRVHQLAADHPQFPPPVARLASGSVWLRAAVESFAEKWERKPGRPRRRPGFTDVQKRAVAGQVERSRQLFPRALAESTDWFCSICFHPAKAEYVEAADASGWFQVRTLRCTNCDAVTFVTGSSATPG